MLDYKTPLHDLFRPGVNIRPDIGHDSIVINPGEPFRPLNDPFTPLPLQPPNPWPGPPNRTRIGDLKF